MKTLLHFCWLVLLTACHTPTREYAEAVATRVTVDQSVFEVRRIGDKAQAIRLNSEWAPRPEAVMPRALVAIEQATDCRVTRMDGDQVIIEARLKCADGVQMTPQTLDYKCDVRVLYRGRADLVCTPGV